MSRPAPARNAFTLLEILLVVLVIGIATGAFLPLVLDSIESARLRAATRDLISMNRYARSRAMLDQRPVAILYDRDSGLVELLQLPSIDLTVSAFLDTPPPRFEDDPDLSAGGITPLRRRQLPGFVTITEANGLEEVDGTWFAVYQSSGMTDPHSVLLRDNRGVTTRMNVNGITGDIQLTDR